MTLPPHITALIEREAEAMHSIYEPGYTEGATVWAKRCMELLEALKYSQAQWRAVSNNYKHLSVYQTCGEVIEKFEEETK